MGFIILIIEISLGDYWYLESLIYEYFSFSHCLAFGSLFYGDNVSIDFHHLLPRPPTGVVLH